MLPKEIIEEAEAKLEEYETAKKESTALACFQTYLFELKQDSTKFQRSKILR